MCIRRERPALCPGREQTSWPPTPALHPAEILAPPVRLQLEESVRITQEILSAGLSENPDLITLCHGGPIEDARAFERIFKETCALGFVGASSMERIPVEKAIYNTIQEFKAVRK